jgi:hypothetical protein
MRTAILGAAASALVGGTLAITPVTSISSIPPPGGPACANGCDQAGAVLMPESAKPQAPSAEPAANVGGASDRPAAANLISPGASASGSSGAHVVPGGASSDGSAAGGEGAPGPDGAPDVPGMDQVAGAAADAGSISQDAAAVQQVWGTAVGVPTSLVGLAGGAAGVLSSVSVSLFYLQIAGLLPKNLQLPSGLGPSSIPGITVPTSVKQAISELPPGLRSVLSGGSVSASAARVPGAAAAIRGATGGGPGPLAAIQGAAAGGPGPLAAIRAGVPQGGLPRVGLPRPSLPATPGWRALPHPHLPGPAAILKPHCIGPHIGPIGACIP